MAFYSFEMAFYCFLNGVLFSKDDSRFQKEENRLQSNKIRRYVSRVFENLDTCTESFKDGLQSLLRSTHVRVVLYFFLF